MFQRDPKTQRAALVPSGCISLRPEALWRLLDLKCLWTLSKLQPRSVLWRLLIAGVSRRRKEKMNTRYLPSQIIKASIFEERRQKCYIHLKIENLTLLSLAIKQERGRWIYGSILEKNPKSKLVSELYFWKKDIICNQAMSLITLLN